MKRWIILLALPYVVTLSSGNLRIDERDNKLIYGDVYYVGQFRFSDKTQAEDMAEALNEAHCQQRKNAFEQSCVERASHFTPL